VYGRNTPLPRWQDLSVRIGEEVALALGEGAPGNARVSL
jgi:hypothetical protein